jgi:hypothetical protein
MKMQETVILPRLWVYCVQVLEYQNKGRKYELIISVHKMFLFVLVSYLDTVSCKGI